MRRWTGQICSTCLVDGAGCGVEKRTAIESAAPGPLSGGRGRMAATLRLQDQSLCPQAESIKAVEGDPVTLAITADQSVAGKAVRSGMPSEVWQVPEKGVADAGNIIPGTKAAFRLSIKREERPQSDLFEAVRDPRRAAWNFYL